MQYTDILSLLFGLAWLILAIGSYAKHRYFDVAFCVAIGLAFIVMAFWQTRKTAPR